MTDAYFYAVRQLCVSLSLPEPQDLESVTSLQIGDHVCHITEHPADSLLMFVSLEPNQDLLAQEQNLFSQDLCKPLLGLDPATGVQVLWNRQFLPPVDRAMAHHQLEMLIQAAERLTGRSD